MHSDTSHTAGVAPGFSLPRWAVGLLVAASLGVLAACDSDGQEPPSLPEGAEAISLLGDTLYPAELPAARLTQLTRQLADAREAYEANPDDADAIIWLGRRTAYLSRYREAIDIYTEGIAKHPDDPRMYRHRGHRFISTRMFDRAVDDLQHAAGLIAGTEDEIEPDGQPNARDIPTSTLHSNLWYHLGLARYLQGDFKGALPAYRQGMEVSRNPDMLVATSHWLYMTLSRLGADAGAAEVLGAIRADLDVIENHSYHQLLLMYKGELDPESLWGSQADALANATVGYGIGNWHLYNGRREAAERVFRRVLETGSWASFGYLASEAELSRLGEGVPE